MTIHRNGTWLIDASNAKPTVPKDRDSVIHFTNGKWWWWNEQELATEGPFQTQSDVVDAIKAYAVGGR